MTADPELSKPPLDAIMHERGLTNADLVEASTAQLTFKMVQKARKGKPISLAIQKKILAAFQTLSPDEKYTLEMLFK